MVSLLLDQSVVENKVQWEGRIEKSTSKVKPFVYRHIHSVHGILGLHRELEWDFPATEFVMITDAIIKEDEYLRHVE